MENVVGFFILAGNIDILIPEHVDSFMLNRVTLLKS